MWAGFIQQAYEAELRWPSVYRIYNRIRRSDPEIGGIVRPAFAMLSRGVSLDWESPDAPSDDDKRAQEYARSLLGDMEGHRDILGHWIGDGAEGANFWLSVLTDLQNRGVADIFLACVDGLNGFSEAIGAVFPQTQVQRCIIHQIRSSLKYVSWKDRKAFVADLKQVYRAGTRDEAEANLALLGQRWSAKYPVAVRSWETNWTELATYFDYPSEIRRIIYTTNSVESYHSQLRKVTKNKAAFPTPEAARKLLYLATERITRNWTSTIWEWAKILNQLAIRFEGRFEL